MLTSSPVLALSENKKSALILCKSYNAEFVGPGSAVSIRAELGYKAAIAIGSPVLIRIDTPALCKSAYKQRIAWLNWLEKLTAISDPSQRSEKLLSSLSAFFSSKTVANISDEVLALLIGVLPSTMQSVRQEYYARSEMLTSENLQKLEPQSSSAIAARGAAAAAGDCSVKVFLLRKAPTLHFSGSLKAPNNFSTVLKLAGWRGMRNESAP